jgi:hypothetical protein
MTGAHEDAFVNNALFRRLLDISNTADNRIGCTSTSDWRSTGWIPSARTHRLFRTEAFAAWRDAAGVAA